MQTRKGYTSTSKQAERMVRRLLECERRQRAHRSTPADDLWPTLRDATRRFAEEREREGETV